MNIAAKTLSVAAEAGAILEKLGVDKVLYTQGDMPSYSPVTGEKIGSLKTVSAEETAKKIEKAHAAFRAWRLVPAPKRGELVRLLGEELRAAKDDLGRLVSIEAGKIRSEGLGYFTYSLTAKGKTAATSHGDIGALIDQGLVQFDPIVYEDFLPVSAAGIFQSNLGDGAQQDFVASPNQQRFEADLGMKVLNEFDHYAGIEQASIDACLQALSKQDAAE